MKVVLPGLHGNKDGTVKQQINHDPFSRLAQQQKHLRPRVFLESLDMWIGMHTEQSWNCIGGRRQALWGIGCQRSTIPIAQQVLWPFAMFLLPFKEEPNDKVNNLEVHP